MSASASAPACFPRQSIGFFQPAVLSFNNSISSSFLHSNFDPSLLCSSTSLAPQLADSAFSTSDPFASFFSDTYLVQDQFHLSTAFSDASGVTPTVSTGYPLDGPSQAFLSTEDFDFGSISEQLLIPSSIDHSPAYTPPSEGSELQSMQACEQYLLSLPSTSNTGDSGSETSQPHTASAVHSVNSTNGSPIMLALDLSTAPAQDAMRSPASSSSSTTQSRSSRKRQRADDVKRSEEEIADEKRQRNTMAARRFRKRKEDRVSNLEKQLADALRERDELKLQVARLEGQNMMLRK
ncbi:hypothetical protein FQN49_001353 [Arthroderma sp. PD_2]|nr:hypothetical protein FQN49_001353 [Arthroderma sp. PD_2]